MDQYKFYDPAPKKKNHWSGARALAKLIKPRKERSRERLKSSLEGQTGQADLTEPVTSPSSSRPLTVQQDSPDNTSVGSEEKEGSGAFTSKAGRIKFPFMRSKSQDKEKSAQSQRRLSKRLRFWSSFDIPSSKSDSRSLPEIRDF
ncbi:hypothetical protein FKM82_017101 [Ascaphus truei]